MTYQQLITPKVPWPYVGGWCQGFVEGSFGQATAPKQDAQGNWYTVGPFPSAKAAWDANYGDGRHPGEQPPKGVAVPVYFTLGSTPAGHVAISMPDGTVLSSTQGGWHSAGTVHPNLQDLINVYAKYNNGCTYLGWSEYAGKAQVVKGSDMDQKITFEEAEELSQTVLLRPVPVTRAWFDKSAEKNMTFRQVYDFWKSSEEAKNARFKVWDYDKLKQRLTVDSAGAVDKLEQIRAIVG